MNGRVFTQRFALGALALGAAAALSGCQPSSSTSAGGSSQPTSSQSQATSGATGNGGATGSGATGGSGSGNGGSTSGGSGSGQGGSGGSNACTGGSVSVKFGTSDAGMGHRSIVLLFTNSGSSSCTLSGYPGATVTENGQYNWAPRMNAERTLSGYEGGPTGISTVTLAPGATASAVLEWVAFPSDGQSASAANCPGMGGGYLEITPPNTTTTSKFDPPTDMCTSLQIHPVVSGTTGR